MRKTIRALSLGLSIPLMSLSARTYVSLGYGFQLNAFFNNIVNANVNKVAANSGSTALGGISGLAPYNSNWSLAPEATASPFVHLPEVRINSDWALNVGGKEWGRVGVFGSLSGILPQTLSYQQGAATLKETNSCATADYAKCPLATLNFAPGGSGAYSGELRSNLRFFNMAVGFTFARKLRDLAGGALVVAGELGLAMQSFAVTSQWAYARCTNSAATPCESTSQLRVVQGELRQQSVYALGPVIGASVRYERESSFWFAEFALNATFLFSRIESVGYTNFVAAGTIAFSQSSTAQGVADSESTLLFLPAAVLRFGVHL